jgi:dTDP-4-dehydrorhamnose 3,5-epimerase
MEVVTTEIPDVLMLRPKRWADERGFFSETYNKELFARSGIAAEFVQDNHSLSIPANVVRGLHYQVPPFAQAKLVRVLRGAILDVVVDIRRDSPHFGKAFSAVISAENWLQIYVPIGFAHGFQTLEPHTEVAYKVSNVYSPAHERGIAWNDSKLAIPWQEMTAIPVILSDRDRTHPPLSQAGTLF